MSMFSEVLENLFVAETMERAMHLHDCRNTDTCEYCLETRVRIAELRGQTPVLDDVRMLKSLRGGY